MQWSEAKRVLCVRLDALGDVLMTTPALRAIKGSNPERHLTLLTSKSGAAIATFVPEIDDIIVYDAPWMKASSATRTPDHDLLMVQSLAAGRFDGAVIFTVFSQNPLGAAFLCYLAGIPLRLAHCRENPYLLLTDWVKETEPESGIRHEVVRQLELAEAIGARTIDQRMSLAIPPRASRRALRVVHELGLGERWVAMHPGASAPSRRYPPGGFAAAARMLHQAGFRIVLTGSLEEAELVRAVQGAAAGADAVSLAGKLTLGELAALYRLAPVVVTNNTGPAHIAAAVGTAVVDLYALTNPQHTPWGAPSRVLSHDVPCRNCFRSICPAGHHNCLRLVRPEQIVDAVLELYRERRQNTFPIKENPHVYSWS